jgi:hypothetical protein
MHHRSTLGIRLLGSCLALLLLASFATAQQPGSVDLAQEVNATFGLARSEVSPVLLQGDVSTLLTAVFQVAGEPVAMELVPHSVRAPEWKLLEQGPDGALREVAAGAPRTLRGKLLGDPDSLVAASLLDEGLYARIVPGSGEEYWLQPIAAHIGSARPEQHVVFATSDILDVDRTCGTDFLPDARPFALPDGPFTGGTQEASTTKVAELACDADYEYFLDYGTTNAVQNRIESVVNSVNVQYERDVDITHEITTIIVRTSSNDPYSSSDASTLLNQFRNHWNSSQGGVQRDMAQLFTGKAINGGTIGIAWVGTVCNLSYAYSVVESDFNGNFSCATDLSAHELGHSWSAGHCSCTSYTMNPYITCANQFHPTQTIPEIVNFASSKTCLGQGGGGDPPGEPTSVHVASVTPSLQGAGKGKKKAVATVVIVDDLGDPVSGASVTVAFSGDLNESVSGTTNGSGSVTLLTNGTKKGKTKFTACVTSVSASLPYVSGDNAETCDSN